MDYTLVASSEERAEWLAARRQGVTATDVAALATGGQKVWNRLKAEKRGLVKGFQGNRYTAWGLEREPLIAAKVMAERTWMEPNSWTVAHVDRPEFMATPDMIGEQTCSLVQIKTANVEKPWDSIPTRYFYQCQWEMFVTGAESNDLVVEYYRDDAEIGLTVADPFADPEVWPIERDEDTISELVEIAESFLSMGEPSYMDVLLDDYAVKQERVESAQAELDEVKALIRKEIGERESFKHVSDAGSVTLTTPKPSARLDSAALKKAEPELWERFAVESVGSPRLLVKPAKEDT